MNFRIGQGYDVHKLVEGRKLILGGVEIPHATGLLGHSDADALLHAITDALLGAAMSNFSAELRVERRRNSLTHRLLHLLFKKSHVGRIALDVFGKFASQRLRSPGAAVRVRC